MPIKSKIQIINHQSKWDGNQIAPLFNGGEHDEQSNKTYAEKISRLISNENTIRNMGEENR